MKFHTRPSTWLLVTSVVLASFSALPTVASLSVGAVNVVVLVLLVWTARHEGRRR